MVEDLPNPHDRYFREAFGDPDVARDFFQYYLPPDIAQRIDLSSLEMIDGSFVDETLRDHASDMLYRVNISADGDAFLYILVEHKSYPDRMVAFQLLRYVVRIWERLDRFDGQLPPVLPVVLYHGEKRWNSPGDVVELIASAGAFASYLPQMRYYLCDLSAYSPGEIVGGVHARLSLRLLQMVFSPELGAQLPEILALARELTEPKTALQWLETALRYVVAASPHVGLDEVQSAIDIVLTDDRSDIMPTLAERWIEQGKQQGLAQGLEQGIEQGRRQMSEAVIALLTSRFGELQPELIDTLRALSIAHLQQVNVATLDFHTSAEVMAFIRELQNTH
jgi:predicted transposase YdaD